MNKALKYLFWGYFFIFFRLQIGFDWLPDPIGYYLIYAGCSMLVTQYPHAKKAKIAAVFGLIISFPGVFINLTATELGNWEAYATLLLVVKLIVAYFIFTVLKSLVTDFNNIRLINRTNSVYRFYMTIHFSTLALLSFLINVSGDFWVTLSLVGGICIVIMDIAFLLLIRAIQRKKTVDVQV